MSVPIPPAPSLKRQPDNPVHGDLGLVNRLLHEVTTAPTSRRAMQAACEALTREFGFLNAGFLTPADEGGDLLISAIDGAYASIIQAAGRRIPRHSGLIGRAATTRRRVVSNDTASEPGFSQLPGMDIRSQATFPLLVEGTLLGILSVTSDQVGAFPAPTVDLLELVSERLALLLDRARLVDSLRAELEERRRAELEARRSVSLLNAALNSTADGLLIIDTHGKVAGFNQEFQRLWRLPDDIVATSDDNRLLEHALRQLKDPEAFLARVRELYATPGAVSFDVVEFSDGRVIERYSQPQMLDGAIVGRVWSFRDVTARRQAEEGRRRAEQQLSRAQKLEALGTLAGGVAHDFNNLLGAILGNVELIQQEAAGPASAATAEQVEEIRKACRRARDLIHQILTFAQQREGRREVILIEPIIEEALRLLRASLPASIEIRPGIATAGTPVFADPGQIHQVLMNLATNAAHAMAPRGGTLSIATELLSLRGTWNESAAPRTLPAGDYLLLTLADTGHGMEEAILQKIFDPFFTTKPPGEGTGLGLAVVDGIVRDLQGGILVQSEPGCGTSFRLFLPVAPRSAVDPAPCPPPVRRGAGERILVVDDEPPLARVAKGLLLRLGYQPVCVETPEQALALLEGDGPFDLLLTDLNMPRMTGLDLAAAIRGRGMQLPILLMTGFASHAALSKKGAAGVDLVVEKPFDSASLAASVSAALVSRQPTEPSGTA